MLFGHLPLRILIQLMSIFLLWLEYQIILNKAMAFSMIQSMIFVITLWHSQLQTCLSFTHKCCMRAIINKFWGYGNWTQWSYKSKALDTHVAQRLAHWIKNNHDYLVIQTKMIPRRHSQQTQRSSLRTCRAANLGPRLFGHICSSYNLG